MDAQQWARLSAQLDDLLDLEPAARSQKLQSLHAADPALALELQRLLELEHERSDFLQAPLHARLEEAAEDECAAGDQIGPYRLLRILGEGGMGTVWLAERCDGLYRREVALKRLRGAGNGTGLRARFARERQILAQLAHPNIAKLFDAGIDERGLPYLALEYIEGETLIDYAQRRGLDVVARIRLFLQVCEAVAYAHSRLVVHRDLKPSNILVTAGGEVRLLDFGIAKLLDREATTGQTELTRLGTRAYTLQYAAPEQIRGETVSTQTDVYSLGVVLYELLAGQRPYRLQRGSAAELEEAILQHEPRRPSRVAARAGEAGATHAARQLARRLAGDLDNIVLKALNKVPEQRYASVEAFAKDLQRHLEGRPVSARPDRFGYRAGKFLRRNALAVGLTTATLVLLLGAAAMLFWQGQHALAEARRAQAIQDFMLGLFESTDPNIARRGDMRVAELLQDGAQRAQRELHEQPAVLGELLLTIASLQSGFGRYDEALSLVEASPPSNDDAHNLRLSIARARALRGLGRLNECLSTLQPLREAALKLEASTPLLVADFESMQGRCLRMSGDTAAARIAFQRSFDLRSDNRATTTLVVESLTDLGALDADAGEYSRAIEKMRAALDLLLREHGTRHELAVNLWRSIGALERDRGDPAAAEIGFRKAIELGDALYPDGHPSLAEARRQLAATFIDYGRLDEAEPLLDAVLDYQRRTLGMQHPDVGSTLNSQAILAWRRGDTATAVVLLEQAIALWRAAELDGRLASGLHNLGMVLLETGRAAQAEPALLEALELREKEFGPDQVPVAMTLRQLGEMAIDAGRYDEAQPLLERSLRIEIDRHGAQHPETSSVDVSLARLDYARGRTDAADARITQVLSTLQPSDNERRRVRATAHLTLATARCESGDVKTGREAIVSALDEGFAPGQMRVAHERAARACGK
jgi:serine/threonine protein kinase/Tfp pilus assembly protein PilF